MLNALTGDPDLSRPQYAKYSKKELKNLKYLFSGELTYGPSDRSKLPDLVDFVSQMVFLKTSLQSSHVSIYPQITLRSWSH
jgi:hypothetical protein